MVNFPNYATFSTFSSNFSFLNRETINTTCFVSLKFNWIWSWNFFLRLNKLFEENYSQTQPASFRCFKTETEKHCEENLAEKTFLLFLSVRCDSHIFRDRFINNSVGDFISQHRLTENKGGHAKLVFRKLQLSLERFFSFLFSSDIYFHAFVNGLFLLSWYNVSERKSLMVSRENNCEVSSSWSSLRKILITLWSIVWGSDFELW